MFWGLIVSPYVQMPIVYHLIVKLQIGDIFIMTPMKSLQEWAADCIAKSLLHSLCVTRLATSAFRCQVDSSQRKTITQCLVSLQRLFYPVVINPGGPLDSVQDPHPSYWSYTSTWGCQVNTKSDDCTLYRVEARPRVENVFKRKMLFIKKLSLWSFKIMTMNLIVFSCHKNN